MATSHRVEIKVEAPHDESNPNNHYRTSVFTVSLESPLPSAQIQLLANKFFTDLTLAASDNSAQAPSITLK